MKNKGKGWTCRFCRWGEEEGEPLLDANGGRIGGTGRIGGFKKLRRGAEWAGQLSGWVGVQGSTGG